MKDNRRTFIDKEGDFWIFEESDHLDGTTYVVIAPGFEGRAATLPAARKIAQDPALRAAFGGKHE